MAEIHYIDVCGKRIPDLLIETPYCEELGFGLCHNLAEATRNNVHLE